ncbi:MAG TPA: SIS domain-containing protein [Solirubrobacteraceae bacterium]|nr:SIS domain-containing protein [Solirubrobacteraceae bacterium]
MSDNRSALAVVALPEVDEAAAAAFVRGVIRQRVNESIAVKRSLLGSALIDSIVRLSDQVVESIRAGGKVLLFGNGGSAADATHLAAEFVGRFAFDRAPMPALSLSDNMSAVTAIGNDYAYDITFARQIKALGSPHDVAIGLSTSGSSPNVLNAMRAAREAGIFTAAFTGAKGAEMTALADVAVVIPSASTARIQEGYMLCAHIMCEVVEQTMFGVAR